MKPRIDRRRYSPKTAFTTGPKPTPRCCLISIALVGLRQPLVDILLDVLLDVLDDLLGLVDLPVRHEPPRALGQELPQEEHADGEVAPRPNPTRQPVSTAK